MWRQQPLAGEARLALAGAYQSVPEFRCSSSKATDSKLKTSIYGALKVFFRLLGVMYSNLR